MYNKNFVLDKIMAYCDFKNCNIKKYLYLKRFIIALIENNSNLKNKNFTDEDINILINKANFNYKPYFYKVL